MHAMALVTTKLLGYGGCFRILVFFFSTPTPLLSHNTCSISIARDPIKHELTKHIGVMPITHCVQVQDDMFDLRYVPSKR